MPASEPVLQCKACRRRHLGLCGPEIEIVDPALTYRENQIVYLICRAASNGQMAAELGLPERTVKNHLYTVFNKAGVDTRLQLGLKYIERPLTMRIQTLEESLAQARRENARMKASLERERSINNRLLARR